MSRDAPATRPSRPGRAKTLLFAALVVAGLCLLLELTCRAYWGLARGVGASRILYAFYPELEPIHTGDDAFDVLLLGGSVLEYSADALARALETAAPGPVRVHNAAREAHATLDSLIKYEALSAEHFDIVVVYHGINEVRANNIAPEDYRDDYTHYAWYGYLRALKRHPAHGLVSFPFTLHYLWLAAEHRLGLAASIPTAGPPPELTRYGGEIKTRRAFGANLEGILDLAARRGEPVLLMTFAWYVPEDYSIERFGRRLLDYDPDELGLPIEIWGRPEHVIAGVRAHNEAIREAHRAHPEARFLDQEALMPRDGRYFGDMCHFTTLGIERFVSAAVPEILAAFPGRAPAAPGVQPQK